MGIDVVFKARPFVPLPDADYEELRDAFFEALPDPYPPDPGRFPDMRWDGCEPEPTIEVASLDRLFSPDYPRGYWPNIRAMGDWLAVHLGELAELRYGGDSADEWECLTQWGKVRPELEALWHEREGD